VAPNTIDLPGLSTAICKGIVEGNSAMAAALIAEANRRHALRDMVQTNTDKVWEIDGELKLLKGVMVTLVGSGDGSTGMVPRLERDMRSLGEDVAGIKTDMREVQGDVAGIRQDITKILNSQAGQQGWMDGWKGVGVALGIIGTCVTVVGGIITALIWLYAHGIRR
jgi:hypothetical protein